MKTFYALLIGILSISYLPAQNVGSITIDPARVLGAVNPMVFGNNLSGATNQYKHSESTGDGAWNPATGAPRPDFLALTKNMGISTVRYPGGEDSNIYIWTNFVGPFANRTNVFGSTNLFGIDEWINWSKAAGATPVFLVNYHSTAADAANLVEYLNSPADASHPWAQNRAAWGHPNPYYVTNFELGNEAYLNPTLFPSGVDYALWATNLDQAMKAKVPWIRTGLNVKNFWWNVADEMEWNTNVFSRAKTAGDFAIVHTYPGPNGIDGPFGPTNMVDSLNALLVGSDAYALIYQQIQTKVQAQCGRLLPVALTEYNGYYPNTTDPTISWYIRSWADAFFCGDLTRQLVQLTNNIAMANYFIATGLQVQYASKPAIIAGQATTWSRLPAYFVYQLWGQHTGSNLIAANVTSPVGHFNRYGLVKDAATNAPTLAACASRRPDGTLCLMVFNRDPSNEISATISVTNISSSGLSWAKCWQVTSPSITNQNPNDADMQTMANAAVTNLAANGFTVTLPRHSMTAFEIGLFGSGSGSAYADAVLANNPLACWHFNETNNPVGGTLQAYDYSGNFFNATYGSATLNGFNGMAGPQPPGFLGFESNNVAFFTSNNVANTYLTAPALNLNTNAATFALWIKPAKLFKSGLLVNRNGSDAAGFGIATNSSGPYLNYTWNSNSATTYGFNSQLTPPTNVWSFVALVISPTNAVIYLNYIDPVTSLLVQSSATNTLNHFPETFGGGTTLIGSDSLSASGRTFQGAIDEVAVFNQSLSPAMIQSLFRKAVAPSVSCSLSASNGPAAGGNVISITGLDVRFPLGNGTDITNVMVCGVAATILSQTTNSVTVLMGTGGSGLGNIVIQSVSQSSVTIQNGYTYNSPGSLLGSFGAWGSISNLPASRAFLAATSGTNGVIYAVGGVDASLTTQPNAYAYNPQNPTAGWTIVSSLPAVRDSLGAATDNNGKIYAIGGEDNSSTAQSTVYVYDPAQPTAGWLSVSNLPAARNHLAAASVNGKLYAVGGADNARNAQSSVYVYDPAQPASGWLSVSNLPAARRFLAAASANGKLYAIGGDLANTAQSTVYVYDPAQPTVGWLSVSNLPAARNHLAAASVNGKLYAIGGQDGSSVLQSTVYMYDPAQPLAGWSSVTVLPQPGYELAAAGVSGQIYAIGGVNSSWSPTNNVYQAALTSGVSPAAGPITGGMTVTLTGINLGAGDVTNVMLCGIPAVVLADNSPTQLVVMASATVLPVTGNVVINSTSYGTTIASNAYTYQAVFATVTGLANPTNGGSVTGGGSYLVGTTNGLTAVASNGWVFVQWSDSATNNPRPVVMPASGTNYTARFSSLTVPATAGSGVYTNRFGFMLTGALNQVVVLEACTNLASPVWLPLQTNTLSGSPVLISDPSGMQSASRFYRLRNQ